MDHAAEFADKVETALWHGIHVFLNPDHYVNVPRQSTYLAAYRGLPQFWRNVLEGQIMNSTCGSCWP